MRDPEIDALLRQAAGAKPEIDPSLIERLSQSVGSSLQPVRPLAPAWILAGGLVLLCAAVATAGALILGPKGIRNMSALDIGAIFPVLAILIWLASVVSTAEAVPGSRRPVAPWMLAVCACLALAAVFGLLFHDYRTDEFVYQGMKCLIAGLVEAVPASLGAWWILRRGFAVNSLAAGFAKGTLAGLAGVTMLELHCPRFEVLHLVVWHIAVLPLSGLAGMAAAWMGRRRRAAAGGG